MSWVVHGERSLYESRWVELLLSDVELPDGSRFEHHLIKIAPSVAVAVVDERDRVLMLWRHRFTTDTWNWELPGGAVEPGETLEQAGVRETVEETGWEPSGLATLAYVQPITGISNAEQHVFEARAARRVGSPVDSHESDGMRWIPLADMSGLITERRIVAAASVAGVLQLLLNLRR
ncbi:ADP-ribose pyrophosphatase YjhB, NUDIX family [Lentzea albidocapillata subsp. violacea]|uniref:ADP-ribose pyrophosphatase YjhB, NUDIX family n=1 Tax=Lentzea albidocapillata subsp. violacea TaxID=128104 RepID=A0A1G9LQ85_9PSEU|nr:NUDIX hydrolase [Lentzea albidocapillata]SDL64096.1 ADP-ribose pyrophosphatase YjhB, NUDIX family [Lentzea albidocapillata subsp. violacea]